MARRIMVGTAPAHAPAAALDPGGAMTPEGSDDPVAGEVVELRVHGVSGTTPEDMLADAYPEQISGDEAARVFRRTAPVVEPFEGRRRTVEAFHWGRFTAGSATRALWLLLVPFALLNLARFTMLLPHRTRTRRVRDRAATAVLRLLGLALTLLLVVTAGYVGWVIGAPQIGWWPGAGSPGYRVLLGAVPPAAVVALVWWLGRQVFIHDPPGGPGPWRTAYGSFDDLGFWHGSPTASRLRAAHVVAALGGLGLLALGLIGSPGTWATAWESALYVVLVAANAIAVVVGVVLVALDREPPPDEHRSSSTDSVELPAGLVLVRRWAALPAAVLAVTFAAWTADHGGHEQTGTPPTEIAANVVSVLGALLLVLLLATTQWQRTGRVADLLRHGEVGEPSYPPVPVAFRPFWNGFGPWMLAAVAVALAFGLSTVAVFWARTAAGDGELPLVFRLSAVLWGVIAIALVALSVPLAAHLLDRDVAIVPWVLALGVGAWAFVGDRDTATLSVGDLRYALAVALAVLAIVLIRRQGDHGPFDALLEQDYPGEGTADGVEADDLRRGRQRVRDRWFIAEARTRYHVVVGTLAGLSGAALVVGGLGSAVQLWSWLDADGRPIPAWVRTLVDGPLYGLGVAVVSAIAGFLVALGFSAWRDPNRRRVVGIVWDLLSFWPRDAHPLCPPPYGGRAVLGVATRAVQLAETPADGGLGARAVVLSGHSQGSLISVAAVAVLDYLGWPTADPAMVATEPAPTPEGRRLPWLHPKRARRVLPRLSLVTYGSQLQFLYARLFPTYFGFGRVAWLYAEALRRVPADEAPLPVEQLSRWRNLFRWTDPLGAPVLAWPAGDRPERPGPEATSWTTIACTHQPCPGHAPVRRESPLHGLAHTWYFVGPDIRLVDPSVVAESEYEPRLPPRGHSDYPLDPVFDAVVADLATPPAAYAETSGAPPPEASAGAEPEHAPAPEAPPAAEPAPVGPEPSPSRPPVPEHVEGAPEVDQPAATAEAEPAGTSSAEAEQPLEPAGATAHERLDTWSA